MDPPTCTGLVKVVRTTDAVATWLLLPDEEAVLSLLPLTAMATPPATSPPTRAPATAAMTTTCRAENSAIGARHGLHSGARIDFGIETGGRVGGVFDSRRVNLDISRRARAVDPPGWRAYLLAAQLVDPLDGRTVRVHAGAHEVGRVPGGVGVVGDAVGPHAGDVLQLFGLIRRGGDRVGGPQLVLGRGQVLGACTGEVVDIPCRLGPLRDGDVDYPGGVDGRVGLAWIAVAALAGSPLVHQPGRAARRLRGRGASATCAAAGPRVGAGPRTGAGPQAGDLRGAGPAAAGGQREGGRRDEDRERARPRVHPGRAPGASRAPRRCGQRFTAFLIAFHCSLSRSRRCWG